MSGFRSRSRTETGKRAVVFNRSAGFVDKPVTLPCGKCVGCRIMYSRSWALRCVHEAKGYIHNSFVTLTYNDEHLPPNGSLSKHDLQCFFKRLRKAGFEFRYFACSEYGDKDFRPHYHVLFFGLDFHEDRRYFKKGKGNNGAQYTSKTLTEIWGKGYCTIGHFSYQSAAYVARYVLKKINASRQLSDYTRVDLETGELVQLEAEGLYMSRRPGIGAAWYDAYSSDAFPDDFLVHDGKKHPVPRYYFDKLKKEDPQKAEAIKLRRAVAMKAAQDEYSPDRLDVKEQIALSKKNLFMKREL